ncbi:MULTISPECIES: glucosaminidase domain-containing protein [unclassified Fusibacter]|uniref:glucosaminidase domain-containing protein n=1 Tax=unclassified Fusibacter TaxID=2624464 RepID=UPI0013E913F6|nr:MULTISPECIES: glucosaminidase domain-containing protein [unclassified Fusibacter]MCK8060481.1 glucosaminidase domain-containing protein [Fusibacter sp. A2]NPE20230.1 glucosaminidase domain-containing protein [Fusibacter sp. A1]
MIKSVNRHIPINSPMGGKSSYASTKARFEQILKQNLKIDTGHKGKNLGGTLTGISSVVNTYDAVEDLRASSGDSVNLINEALKDTPMQGLGQAFKNAELKYGVNAVVLVGIGIHESAYGKSSIAKNKNNLFGFMAYDDSPFKSSKTYGSMVESIEDVAKLLSEKYLSENGKYYEGKTLDDVGKHYATDPSWSEKVKKTILKINNTQV